MKKIVMTLIGIAACAAAASADIIGRYSFSAGPGDSVGAGEARLRGTASIAGGELVLDGGGWAELPAGWTAEKDCVAVEAWFTYRSGGDWIRVFDFGVTNASGRGARCWYFTPRYPGGSRTTFSNTDPGFQYEETIDGGSLPPDVPIHIVVIFDSRAGKARLFVDGRLAGERTLTVKLSEIGTDHLYLGKSSYASDALMAGSISEFRIYDAPLDEEQVRLNHELGPDVLRDRRTPETVDEAANSRIRSEAADRSQVMQTLHVLTDLYGPRLSGTPNYKSAAEWAAQRLTEWGLQNARLEPWDFGHPGWSNERITGFVLSPFRASLGIHAVAWTPSTEGPVKAPAVQLIPPVQATEGELSAWLDANASVVRGKIVLVGAAADTTPKPRAPKPGPGGPPAVAPQRPKPDPNILPAARAEAMIDSWLVSNGALVRLYDGALANGAIGVFRNRTFDATKALPGAALRNDDYGRIERLLRDGRAVEMEFDIVNRWHPEGRTGWNVVAEIPGTDAADEIVMLGAHLDSWHVATGAADDGAATAMMMEAVRIISQSGLKPRRTIRIGLWSAEEQGLLGSQAYVKAHFGSFENPKPDFGKILCYFNMDSGAGSVSRVMVFGPKEAELVLRDAIAPFGDLGAGGSSAFLSRALGSTDSSSFSHAGISTVDMMQHPGAYGATIHSNLDTYDRVSPADCIKGATVIAAAVWHVANRGERLPLFTKEQMPAPVPDRE